MRSLAVVAVVVVAVCAYVGTVLVLVDRLVAHLLGVVQ